METIKEAEEPVFRVTLRSSTKSRLEVTNSSRSRRSRRRGGRRKVASNPDSGEEGPTPGSPESLPRVEAGSGVDQHRILEDVSAEVRRELGDSGSPPIRTTVTFDDVPMIIPATLRVDEYDIVEDIKSQKANVTIGQLLHDNLNYQKVIREAWSTKRRRKTKLPSVAANFLEGKDQGAPEITVVVEGCTIP